MVALLDQLLSKGTPQGSNPSNLHSVLDVDEMKNVSGQIFLAARVHNNLLKLAEGLIFEIHAHDGKTNQKSNIKHQNSGVAALRQ